MVHHLYGVVHRAFVRPQVACKRYCVSRKCRYAHAHRQMPPSYYYNAADGQLQCPSTSDQHRCRHSSTSSSSGYSIIVQDKTRARRQRLAVSFTTRVCNEVKMNDRVKDAVVGAGAHDEFQFPIVDDRRNALTTATWHSACKQLLRSVAASARNQLIVSQDGGRLYCATSEFGFHSEIQVLYEITSSLFAKTVREDEKSKVAKIDLNKLFKNQVSQGIIRWLTNALNSYKYLLLLNWLVKQCTAKTPNSSQRQHRYAT